VAIDPLLVFLNALLPKLEHFNVSALFLGLYNHFDGVVDHQRLLEHLLSDVLTALWAFLLSNEALADALVAE
jgi:hypothetical protein